MKNGFWKKLLIAGALTVLSLPGSGAAASSGNDLTVLMYHDLTENPNQTDSLTVTTERFRLDMEFLQEFGYTPLLSADLVAIAQGSQTMPDKAIMITFDDGYRSNYDYAYPILQDTGMKAVIAVVAHNIQPEATASDTRGSFTWEEAREMVASGVVEIGSHTYNLHNPQYAGNNAPDGINGVMRLRGEPEDAYRLRVGSDLKTSIEMITQYTGQPQVLYFAYPYGAYDSWMPALLQENGILISSLTNAGQAHPLTSLYNLPRNNVHMDKPLSAMLQETATATPAAAQVSLNGTQTTLTAYNIGGNNYVRVRDVAVLLKDTAGGYDVQWDEGLQRVELTSFTPYTPLGTENAPLPAGKRTVRSLIEPTAIDGTLHTVAAYNIDGSTYYKLRSLGDLCGFQVDWDENTQTVLVTA